MPEIDASDEPDGPLELPPISERRRSPLGSREAFDRGQDGPDDSYHRDETSGIEIDPDGQQIGRQRAGGAQAEATPRLAPAEDSLTLMGIVVIDDVRRS